MSIIPFLHLWHIFYKKNKLKIEPVIHTEITLDDVLNGTMIRALEQKLYLEMYPILEHEKKHPSCTHDNLPFILEEMESIKKTIAYFKSEKMKNIEYYKIHKKG